MFFFITSHLCFLCSEIDIEKSENFWGSNDCIYNWFDRNAFHFYQSHTPLFLPLAALEEALSNAVSRELTLAWGTGIVGHVAASKEHVNIRDAYQVRARGMGQVGQTPTRYVLGAWGRWVEHLPGTC